MKRAMKKADRAGRLSFGAALETLSPWLVLILVYAFLLSRFDLKLLFSDTVLTGGDSASWYQVLSTLKNDFLPRGRLFGFSQSNFFGYLEGQHYFILPFFSAALLGFFAPLTVALKIATVAGGFALPAAMFAAASAISGKKRAGALAAATALLFLFNESYSIFGGNWLSTFAGEFCFSWATALLPLLAASVVVDWRKNRKGVLSGILLGLIGLSHFFVFMPAFFLPFFPAFGAAPRLLRKPGGPPPRKAAQAYGQEKPRGEAQVTLRILTTYGIAFLLMAFWLLPMAATRAWAQPISMIWRFSSFADFARQTLAWVWAPLAAVFLFIAIRGRGGREQRRFMAFSLYALAACAFLFFAAPGLGMPDIRFVPSALLFCALAAAVLVDRGLSLGRIRAGNAENTAQAARRKQKFLQAVFPPLVLFALAVVAMAAAAGMTKNAAAWFRWNYSGYEAKSEWPSMKALSETYRGSPDEGRFLWEKQDQRDNRDFGSERAFENLALFTGHPSSEGIHYGSSMMARAATYLQSSYSLNPVDPEAERIYSRIDPDSWPARFSLLNARYIITHSEEMRTAFAAHPRFALDSAAGKFSVFRFLDYPGHYVEVLPEGALSVVKTGSGGFRADYYRFFREYETYGFPFVSAVFADRALASALKSDGASPKSYDDYRALALARAALDKTALEKTAAPSTSRPGAAGLPGADESGSGRAISGGADGGLISGEHVDNFSIRFDTKAPGLPHYIKISYAPGWRSLGGEKIYPAAPGFMLVFPKTGRVELAYRWTIWEIAGALLSALALPAALLLSRTKPGKRFPWRLLLGLSFGIFAAAALILILQTSAGYPALARDIEAARKLNLSLPSQRAKALSLVEPWAKEENLDRFDNRLAFDAFRIKALALLRQGEKQKAAEALEILRAHYPGTRALDSLPTLQ